MKKQSGDPMLNQGLLSDSLPRHIEEVKGLFEHKVHKDQLVRADISFQDTAQDIVDAVEKDIKPLMKRMTGRHYSKILEDLEKVRKLADSIRREAESQRI